MILSKYISEFLGVFEDGIIEFSYIDIVKSAGHSCPTVAGAFLVTLTALKVLYKNEIPQRGNIHVSIKDSYSEGVTGVVANVFSHITGATDTSGFKGIGGRFVRHSLMHFDAKIEGMYRFTRKDNGFFVDVNYHAIPPNPRQQILTQKIMSKMATDEEKLEFGQLWQERVRTILIDLKDDPRVINIV